MLNDTETLLDTKKRLKNAKYYNRKTVKKVGRPDYILRRRRNYET